jgi:cytoskeleton protein RodZ
LAGSIDTAHTRAYIFSRMASTSPFGEHLRRERELRGVSLAEVASATRISTRFLEAIENGHWDQLPGGAFNRGFIRSASRYLGLDEDSMVAEYSLEIRNGHEGIVPRSAARIPQNRKGLTALAVAVAAILLVIAGGWYGTSKVMARRRAAQAKRLTEPAQVVQTSANGSATQAANPLQLLVRATRATGLRVIADGTRAFDGQINANEVKQFGAHDTFEIAANDAAALHLELNGHALATMGRPGQAGRITLTAKDVRSSAGGSH